MSFLVPLQAAVDQSLLVFQHFSPVFGAQGCLLFAGGVGFRGSPVLTQLKRRDSKNITLPVKGLGQVENESGSHLSEG